MGIPNATSSATSCRQPASNTVRSPGASVFHAQAIHPLTPAHAKFTRLAERSEVSPVERTVPRQGQAVSRRVAAAPPWTSSGDVSCPSSGSSPTRGGEPSLNMTATGGRARRMQRETAVRCGPPFPVCRVVAANLIDLARIEGVAEAVAHVVDGQHREEDQGAGEERLVRV